MVILDFIKHIDSLFERFQKTSIGSFLLRKGEKNFYSVLLIFSMIVFAQLSVYFIDFLQLEQKIEYQLKNTQEFEYIFWLIVSFLMPEGNMYMLVFGLLMIVIIIIIKIFELKKTSDSFYRLSGDGDIKMNFNVIEALLNKDYVEAEKLAREYLKKYPNSIRARYNLSIALSNQKDDSKMLEAKDQFEGIATDKNLFALLKLHENIDDPIDFILNDPGLKELFEKYPILRNKVELLKIPFNEMMGTKNYGGGCFPSGTRIALPKNKYKSIQNIKIGDKVLSYDEKKSSISISNVVRVGKTVSDIVLINKKYHVSTSQPLYTIDNGWVIARNLSCGERLFTIYNKYVAVTSLEYFHLKQKVYWIEVEPDHTYFANTILAHNKVELG